MRKMTVGWWDVLPMAPKIRGGKNELKLEAVVDETANRFARLRMPMRVKQK